MFQIDARVTKNPQLPVEMLVAPENKQLLKRIFSILGIKVKVNNANVQRCVTHSFLRPCIIIWTKIFIFLI